ncbi:putative secreted protein (Por secretion system target), partial [Christiangramia gaetbulicola]
LTAIATDNDGESTTSGIINITIEAPNQLPAVAITSPLNNEVFTSPANIVITAEASDPNGSVSSVEFFEGTNSLGIDNDGTDGWSVTWNGLTTGSYALTAVATDNDLETTTSEIINITVEAPNQLPAVAITTPLNNEVFTSPADIVITADVTDTDGTVTSVEFFEGTNSLGIDTDGTDGWSVTWNGVTTGSYTLTAVATDNDLETTTSEIINITVEAPNQLPTVAITTPLNNEVFTSPADIAITADATDPDGNVNSVEFFEGTNSLGIDSDGTDGWSVTWNGVTTGSYALTAVATDNDLETTTSESINITVEAPNQLPAVAITSPLNNEVFTSPTDIVITADATDPDGTVTSVEFFEGTNSLGIDTDGTDGWNVTWNGVTTGSYALTAVATDNDLETITSEIINITVEAPNQLPTVAITSPLNSEVFTSPADITITADATDPDGTVTSVEFFEGTNSLGIDTDGTDGWSVTWNGVTTGSYALTAVARDNEAGTGTSNIITINVQQPLPSITNFIPSSGPVGSIVLLNGFNLSGVSEVSFGPSIAEIISVSNTQLEVRVPPQNGKLPKSVKISVTSPAGQFTSTNKFTVTAGSVPVNNSPVVSFITPAENTGFDAPATIDMLVNASDSDGFVTKVEFFNGNSKLGEDVSSPYEFSWTNVPSGSYSLRAIATDDKGSTGNSGPVNIQVSEPGGNQSPVVSITSPSNNASFTALANINITANASDPDGSITQVEFFNGSSSLGIDSTSPYSVSWNNVTAGTYLLTAIATDNLGLVTTSNVVTVNVSPTQNLNAPSSLSAQWMTNSEVYLIWKDNDLTEDGFILERSTKPDFSGRIDFISLPANTNSYTDRNLNSKKGGGILYYRIKAVKGNISSGYSNTVQAAPLSGAIVASSKEMQGSAINEEFIAYPNPTSGDVTVKFTLNNNRDYTLNLLNSMGAYLMLVGEGKAIGGLEYTYELSVNQYPDGLYFIILKTKDSSQSFSLIIKR